MSQPEKKSGILGEFLSAGAVRFGGTFLTLILNLMLVRLLGAEGYGVYSFALSAGLLASVVGRFGLDRTSIRLLSVALHDNDDGRANGVLRFAFCVAIAGTGVLALAIAAYAPFNETYGSALVFAAPFAVMMSIGLLCQGILRSYVRPPLALAPEFIGRPALAMLCIGAAMAAGLIIEARSAMILHMIAVAGVALISVVLVLRKSPDTVRAAAPVYEVRQWSSISLSIYWGNLMLLTQPQVVVLIAGALLSTQEVGWVSFAARIATAISMPLVVVNLMAAPRIARVYRSGDMAKLQQEVTTYCRLATVSAISIALLLLLALQFDVVTRLEAAFSGSEPLIVAFAVGQLITALMGPAGLLLSMTNFEADVAKVATISFALLLVLSVLGGMYFGGIGIAAASAIALAMRSSANFVIVRRRLGITALPFRWPGNS